MQSIDLCDIVTVEYTPSQDKRIEIICDDPEIPTNEKNIAYKAADKLISCGQIKINIKKNIPSKAGMAGGSADAAATLVALNKAASLGLSEDKLTEIGATIGADVPFCIKGGTCLVTGIGEKLEKLEDIPKIPLVITKMSDGMSTPEAYRKLDVKYNNFCDYSVHQNALNSVINYCDLKEKSSPYELFNIFEDTVGEECQSIHTLKEILLQNGAIRAMMSGSGTAVFGIFDSPKEAEKTAQLLSNKGIFATVSFPSESGIEII